MLRRPSGHPGLQCNGTATMHPARGGSAQAAVAALRPVNPDSSLVQEPSSGQPWNDEFHAVNP